jgi:hypothetical protein
MKKVISKRTRIKLGLLFRKAVAIDRGWDIRNTTPGMGNHYGYLLDLYGLRFTTKRNGIHYFIPESERKLSLFILNYADCIIQK